MGIPQRWTAAFDALAPVEAVLGLGRAVPVLFGVDGPCAVRRQLRPELLPADLRDEAARGRDGERATVALGADLVRLGKFDVENRVRLRAFYVGRREVPLALRLQGHDATARPGVARAVSARLAVRAYAPGLAPKLVAHDSPDGDGPAYLLETMVDGRRPRDRGETQELCEPVAGELRRLHRGVGVRRRPLSEAASRRLPIGWGEFVADHALPGLLVDRVEELIARDASVEVSLCHGDLVASNMLLRGDSAGAGFVLVDWEHARLGPIAFDLAKMHVNARRPDIALETFRKVIGRQIGAKRSSYRLEEQFALAHVQMLSWQRHRRRRATAAGRADQLDATTQRRLDLVCRLLLDRTVAEISG